MALFFIIKTNRRINCPNLFCQETLHISGSSSAHHPGVFHCPFVTGMCHAGLQTAFEQEQDGPARKPFPYPLLPRVLYERLKCDFYFMEKENWLCWKYGGNAEVSICCANNCSRIFRPGSGKLLPPTSQ